MISVCIMSCSCAKDVPHLLCEFDAAQVQNRPPKVLPSACAPGLHYCSFDVMLKGKQTGNKT